MYRLCYKQAGFPGTYFLIGTKVEILAFLKLTGISVAPDPYNPTFVTQNETNPS